MKERIGLGLLVGTAGLVVAVAAAAGLAGHEWGRAQQTLVFPWISDVPRSLGALFALTAILTALGALAVAWWVAPEAMRSRWGVPVVLVVVGSAAAQAWSCLYLTTLGDPVIPVFVPVEVLLPPLLAGLAVSQRARPGGAAAVTILAAAPTAALLVLGEGIRTFDPVSGLTFGLFFGLPFLVFGVLIGLLPVLTRRPPPALRPAG